MSASKLNHIMVSHEEIMQAIKEMIIKKYPTLEEEEFEIEVMLDTYNHTVSASADVLD